MIKWAGFGKLLKQLFFISLISFFGLLGSCFVSAGKVQLVGLSSSPSVFDSNYDLTFLKGGGVLSNYLGQGKSVLAFNSSTFFWRTPNGMPYYYNKQLGNYGGLVQGYFGEYWSCDVITGLDYTPTNCSSNPITGDFKSLFQSFFQKVKANDYAYYDFNGVNQGSNLSNQWSNWNVNVCFSSSEIGRSLCFRYGHCYSNQSHGCRSNDITYNYGSLVNSENLSDLSFGTINSSWIGYAPGQNGYGGNFDGVVDGNVDSNIDTTITGDYSYSSCTWKEVLIALESEGYNRYLCYGGLDNFDTYDSSLTYNPIPGTGLSLNQIWAWSGSRAWDSFPQRFTFWYGLYKDTSNNYTAMWESYPAVYRSYFQLFDIYKGSVEPRTILEYCQIRTFTGDTLNNSAGGYFTPVCETIIREKQTGIWDSRLDGSIYSGGIYTGDVPISVNWGGVGNFSGNKVKGDGLTFIQDFFNLSKSRVSTNFDNNFTGYIPSYIIVFMLAIILFRFLRH